MELNYGVWANISSPEDVTWVPLRDAVELHIGPVDLTVTSDILEAFIETAVQAQKSMRDIGTPVRDDDDLLVTASDEDAKPSTSDGRVIVP